MTLFRRLDDLDRRLGLGLPTPESLRHCAKWWRWYLAAAAACVVFGLLLLLVDQQVVGPILVLPLTGVLTLNGLIGWKAAHRRC